MSRSLLIAGVAAASLTLAACGQQAEAPSEATPMPDANAAATVPTMADEAAAPDFVTKAATSDMFEIEAAKIALERSQNAEVKAFAQMMIDQHTKATSDLKAAITESGQALTPPTALPQEMQDELKELRDASAEDFDKAYISGQVDAHQNALNLMKRYAEDGDVAALKTFATTTGAAVQQHYDKAKAMQDAMS
jgi:putative membrane protein